MKNTGTAINIAIALKNTNKNLTKPPPSPKAKYLFSIPIPSTVKNIAETITFQVAETTALLKSLYCEKLKSSFSLTPKILQSLNICLSLKG